MSRGILFAGCGEGKAVALDVVTGKQLGSAPVNGDGVDIIAFAEGLRHLQVPAASGAHCVAADRNGFAYVCDPSHGAILKIPDPYPATR